MDPGTRLITESFKMKKPKKRGTPKRMGSSSVSEVVTYKTPCRKWRVRNQGEGEDSSPSGSKTPVRNARCAMSSPESHFLLSQLDLCRDVTWDYGSPTSTHYAEVKNGRSSARGCIKELITCLDQRKLQSGTSQVSTFNKLVDRWITLGSDMAGAGKTLRSKRSRQVSKVSRGGKFLKELFESIEDSGASRNFEEGKTFIKNDSRKMKSKGSEGSTCSLHKGATISNDCNLTVSVWSDTTDLGGFLFEDTQAFEETDLENGTNDVQNSENQFHSAESMDEPARDEGFTKLLCAQRELFRSSGQSELGTNGAIASAMQMQDNTVWDDCSIDELLSTIPEEQLISDSQKSVQNDTIDSPNNGNRERHAQVNSKLISRQLKGNSPSTVDSDRTNGAAFTTKSLWSFEVCSNVEARTRVSNALAMSACSGNTTNIRSPRLRAKERSRKCDRNPVFQTSSSESQNTPPSEGLSSRLNGSSSQRCSAEQIARKREEALKKRAQRITQASKQIKILAEAFRHGARRL